MPKKILVMVLVGGLTLLSASPVLATESTTNYFFPTYEETDGAVTKYYPLPGGTTAMRRGTDLSYLHSDQISSTRMITDNLGQVTNNFDYYPYGEFITGNLQSTTDKLYTNQILDNSTGLYFYNARQYNPTTGTFISADTTQGPNRYAYVSGNPISRNDPTGNVAPVSNERLKQYGLPDTPKPDTSYLENIKYFGLYQVNKVYNLYKFINQKLINPQYAGNPYMEKLQEDTKFKWASFNFRVAAGITAYTGVQAPIISANFNFPDPKTIVSATRLNSMADPAPGIMPDSSSFSVNLPQQPELASNTFINQFRIYLSGLKDYLGESGANWPGNCGSVNDYAVRPLGGSSFSNPAINHSVGIAPWESGWVIADISATHARGEPIIASALSVSDLISLLGNMYGGNWSHLSGCLK